MHPQTLRIYEAQGPRAAARTPGGTRLYSEADLERLRLIQRLTTELGLNLAGVEHVLRARGRAAPLRARMEQLERELRERDRSVTHKQYRRELVLYRATRQPTSHRRRLTWTSTKLTIKIAGGRRRARRSWRAARGNPESTPEHLTLGAARPGAAAHARSSARALDPDALRAEAEARLRAAAVRLGRRRAAAGVGGVLAACSTTRRRGEARSRTSSSPTEHLLLALDVVPRDALLGALKRGARRPARHVAGSRGHLPGAREVRPRPHRSSPRQGKLDPVIGRDEEIRRIDPGALAPHEEQPGADRRARRRQDGDRRGPRPAHRRGRRARGPRRASACGRSTSARWSPARSTAASSRSG